MAFDFGLRQIGVAVGNTMTRSSETLPVMRAKDGVPVWDDVRQLVQEWQPDLLLVGDPLHMDGSVSALAERARKFARRLHGRLGVEVTMVDERLTSFEAKQLQREHGHKGDYKQDPIDSLAAQLILQTWLSENPSDP